MDVQETTKKETTKVYVTVRWPSQQSHQRQLDPSLNSLGVALAKGKIEERFKDVARAAWKNSEVQNI